jgi:hypothetical protein
VNAQGASEQFRDPDTGDDLPMFATLSNAADRCHMFPVDEGPIHFELNSNIP